MNSNSNTSNDTNSDTSNNTNSDTYNDLVITIIVTVSPPLIDKPHTLIRCLVFKYAIWPQTSQMLRVVSFTINP